MYVATFTVGQEAVSRYYAGPDGKFRQQGSILAALVNFIYAFPAVLGIITLALINMASSARGVRLRGRALRPARAGHGGHAPPSSADCSSPASSPPPCPPRGSDLLGGRLHLSPTTSTTPCFKAQRLQRRGHAGHPVPWPSWAWPPGASPCSTPQHVSIPHVSASPSGAAGAFFPYVLGTYWKEGKRPGGHHRLPHLPAPYRGVPGEDLRQRALGMKVICSPSSRLVDALVFFLVFSKMFRQKPGTRSWPTGGLTAPLPA